MPQVIVPAIDLIALWLHEEIWPEIHAMMHNDGYFKLWLKAQEISEAPHGPIAQMVINGYATYQLAAIRRLCDRRKQADVISLPKILQAIGEEYPYKKATVDSLATRLKTECDALYTLATQYVAHNGVPAAPNWRAWDLTSDGIMRAQKSICEVAIIIERDLLSVTQRTHIIPVPQFDYLNELKSSLPSDKLKVLREFWHTHNNFINSWVCV
jgi:hypothetical protein